jgi:hypothetical protein
VLAAGLGETETSVSRGDLGLNKERREFLVLGSERHVLLKQKAQLLTIKVKKYYQVKVL